jgi:imidazolonepropionase
MQQPTADLLIDNAHELITCVSTPEDPLGRVSNGAVAIKDGRILAVDSKRSIEKHIDLSTADVIDAAGKIVAPGFVDCHTHLIFGGSRVKEYALKMTRSIAEIEATGLKTGIPASIVMTRQASEEELFLGGLDRLKRMLAYGTTTVESKSGYGIRWPDELKMLRVNQRLAKAQPVSVVSTFLGAHDFPLKMDREDEKQREAYIQALTQEMIPRVASQGLAEFCDVYCDVGYYTARESETVLSAGLDNGLAPKIHTDAYANIGGSSLAADLPAISADHLNYTTTGELRQMAAAGVVAVLLPALDFAVAHPDPVKARPMVESGLTLALGTNLNPANWTESMQLVMQLACRTYGMAPEESMLAATTGAARAIGRDDSLGCLAKGFAADLQIWDLPSFEDIIYRLGNNAVWMVIKNGSVVVRTPCE